MALYFTICSNNYLAYATALGRSLRQQQPGTRYLVFLCDEKHPGVDYTVVADEVVVLSGIEPTFLELAARYNIVELNTCIKPRIFEWLFERGEERVVFLDPDAYVTAPMHEMEAELGHHNILLVPHIYSPIPNDGKRPTEADFLNYGIFNLGFIALKKSPETVKLLTWWKNFTYTRGYIDVYNGLFVDQLPMNHVPVYFNSVKIIHDAGLNMAPWNLHERWLTRHNGQYIVNEKGPLRFYHFSGFKADKVELPAHQYTNRYKMQDRPDLLALYQEYNDVLKAANYTPTRTITDAYAPLREAYKKERRKKKWIDKILFRKKG